LLFVVVVVLAYARNLSFTNLIYFNDLKCSTCMLADEPKSLLRNLLLCQISVHGQIT